MFGEKMGFEGGNIFVEGSACDDVSIMLGDTVERLIINKFGRNPDVDAPEDIWNGGGDYTGFPTTSAETFQVASSSIDDTALGIGARTVRVFYFDSNYDFLDGNGEYLFFDVALNGTNWVDAPVSGMRIWKVVVLTSGSGQTNSGSITVRWKNTTSVIFAVMPIGFGQSETSNFTIPRGYTGYIKAFSASMDDSTTNSAQVALKTRDSGSDTFLIRHPFTISTSKNANYSLSGGEILLEKTDVCFRALSVQNTNGIISVAYDILLVKNT